jgi:hypothetical protein
MRLVNFSMFESITSSGHFGASTMLADSFSVSCPVPPLHETSRRVFPWIAKKALRGNCQELQRSRLGPVKSMKRRADLRSVFRQMNLRIPE